MKAYLTTICQAGTALGFLIIVSLAFSAEARAQMHEVDQTIYGMDCAPCAYGIERRLTRTDGITGATISLNDGKAVVQLAPDNRVTLEAIREAIRKNGFAPRGATVEVTGILQQQGDDWIVALPSGEQFRLAGAPEADLSQQQGQRVTVTGHVPEGDTPPATGWLLDVSRWAEGN